MAESPKLDHPSSREEDGAQCHAANESDLTDEHTALLEALIFEAVKDEL